MADDLTALTTKVVAAYLASNTIEADAVPDLIRATYAALVGTASPMAASVTRQEPAVSIRKSVMPSAIICLECGEHLKMLKRHLSTAHGLTVDEYRSKWSLSRDYPVVAPEYAALRSQYAVGIGLGRKRSVQADAVGGEPVAVETTKHNYPPSRWSKPSE